MEQDKKALEPREYKAIAAWGRFCGLTGGFIRLEQDRAAREGAPLDALFPLEFTGGWVRVSTLDPERGPVAAAFLEQYGALGRQVGEGVPSGR